MSSLRNSLPSIVQNIKSVSDFEGYLALVLGLIANAAPEVKFGHCPDAASDVRTDCWELGATIPVYVFPANPAGEDIEVFSASASDTVDITIQGLDVNGNVQKETVTLSGVAGAAGAVAVPGKWIAINRAYNDGSVELIGAVTIRKTGGPEIYGHISTDDQQTSQAIYTVPAGKVAIINNYSTAVNKSGGVAVSAIFTLTVQKPTKVFRTQIRYGLQRDGISNLSSDLIVPVMVPPLSRVKVTANPSAVADVSGEFSMILIDESAVPAAILAEL